MTTTSCDQVNDILQTLECASVARDTPKRCGRRGWLLPARDDASVFIADGAPYPDPYKTGLPAGLRAVAVGWLEPGHDYPRGATGDAFVSRLFTACVRHATARTRGWHVCGFCDEGPGVAVRRDEESVVLGDAELRVVGDDRRLFVAPTLILHYVLAHEYRPPSEFIEAVTRGAFLNVS